MSKPRADPAETAVFKALRESEARYRRIVETAEEGILIVDADQRIGFMNPKMAAMLGYEIEEIVGQSAYALMDGEGRRQIEPRLQLRRLGVREQYEFRFRRKDGGEMWGWISASPIMDEAGKYAGALAMVTDITERKRAEETLKASETKYRALIDNSVDGILLADPDGNLVDINRQGERLLGYSNKELCGMTVARLHPQEELPRVQAAFSQAVDGGYAEYLDGLVLTKDGRKVPVDIRASAIEVGGRKFIQGTFQDITERKERERSRAEEEIAQRNALVREVHHRIKNSLQGVTGLLRRFAASHPDVAPILSEAAGQVQSVAVIHGLQGRAPVGNVAVCDLVRNITANVETLVQTRIDMNIAPHSDPCFILAEPEAVPIALVLNELLFNAVKHARPGTAVRVEVGIDEAGGCTEIRMINAGKLPRGFRLAGQTGEGSGLQLVASLLPRQGALLDWKEEDGEVAAALTLGAPVVFLARIGRPEEPAPTAAAG